MAYTDTTEFDLWVKDQEKKMMLGFYSQVEDEIIHWNTDVTLPIADGPGRWRQFTVNLRSFRVMASYELPFADEDPQFVGVAVANKTAEGFAAPTGDPNVAVGVTQPVGFEVLRITDLDINPYTAELVVRAYDQTEPIANTLLSEFAGAARAALNGVIAGMPFSGPAGRVGESLIDKLHRLAGAPKQVGDTYTLFRVAAPQIWKREAHTHAWTRYKFVVFVEEDPDDSETPHKEIYLTLWELQLLSEGALTDGSNVGKEKARQVKVSDRAETEAGAQQEKSSDTGAEGRGR